MVAQGAIRQGQRLAESTMIDHVTIVRPSVVRDPETKRDAAVSVHVWSGKCKLTTYEPDAVVYTSGGKLVATQEYRLHVPIEAGPVAIGDVATIVGDPRSFRVDGLFQKTWATAQRLKVTEQANREV